MTCPRTCNLPRSQGSSTSLRPSPTKLNESTSRKIAIPGANDSHGALLRFTNARLSILPHVAVGGHYIEKRSIL